MSKKNNDFESSLNRIIAISGNLENEEMKLEEAMTLYKEAMTLVNNCQNSSKPYVPWGLLPSNRKIILGD